MIDEIESEKVEVGTKPTPKKVTKKKVTKKKATKKKVSPEVVPAKLDKSSLFSTFDEWWEQNANLHQNLCVKLLNKLNRPDLKYFKVRKDFGMHLSEKDLCQKVFQSYA
ncbi:MAG: hypothetical protein QM489_00720 [Candidatus Izemoplasma sp.]